MLSKLAFFDRDNEGLASQVDREKLRQALERRFRADDPTATVAFASGGTLGVCFHVYYAGARYFLKTHLPGEQSRVNLAKEADILLRLYGGAVLLDCIEVQLEEAVTRLCLLMTELSQLPTPMEAGEVATMVRSYAERLGEYPRTRLAAGWDLERQLTLARQAVGVLEDHKLISAPVVAELNETLEFLDGQLSALPRILCHGDLGPRNIMRNGSRPVAIDWEDAFWGIAGYDYLYWLTFMDNRVWLHSSAFGRTGLDPAVEHAILSLVVLLKSYLSVRSGSYLSPNMMPIETRLKDVLSLRQTA